MATLLAAVCLVLLGKTRLRIELALAAGPGPRLVEGHWRLGLLGVGRTVPVLVTYPQAKDALLDSLTRLTTPDPRSTSETPSAGAMARAAQAELQRLARSRGLQRLDLVVLLGTGDAAVTAIVCGATNAILGSLFAVMLGGALPSEVRTSCVPDWTGQPTWRLDLNCILRPTVSQAITAAWRAYWLFRLAREGRRKEQGHG